MDFIIMDITSGDLVWGVFETEEEAREWIDNSDFPEKYDVIKVRL